MNVTSLHDSLRQIVWDVEQCAGLASLVLSEPNYETGSEYSVSKGILIQAVMGGGKTSILQVLYSFLHSELVLRLDCATLSLSDRGETERKLSRVPHHKKCFLLLDNIDFLPASSATSRASTPLTMSSRSFTSAALAAIDRPNTIVVATCTNIDLVDACFLHSYRLGKPVKLSIPSKSDRERIFLQILSELNATVTCDVAELRVEHSKTNTAAHNATLEDTSAKELALRTRGFTACDILKLMRDQLQYAQINNPAPATISTITASTATTTSTTTATTALSLRTVLQAISNTTPSAGGSISEAHRFVRDVDANTPVELVGMHVVQKQLLKCIGTVVPELRDAQSFGRSGSVRKCSGIVLVGPSGSGKTALTEWLARATHRHCKFLAVPCADLVHKVVGETERKLAEIFNTARELSPCIVLLDNLDMLLGASGKGSSSDNEYAARGTTGGRRVRSQRTRHHALDRMLSTLLVEIDGLDSGGGSSGSKARPSVIVVATTTRMDCLDRALVRPGRLEEHITLSLPSAQQRRECLVALFDPEVRDWLSGGGAGGAGGAAQRSKDIDDIARCTELRSYAYLRALYQEANITFAREKVFTKLSQYTSTAGGRSGDNGDGSGKIDFSALIAEAGGPAEKVEFVCQFMLKRVKLF